MTIEAVPYKFPDQDAEIGFERRLNKIAEGINGILESGYYVGHIMVENVPERSVRNKIAQEGVILFVEKPAETSPIKQH